MTSGSMDIGKLMMTPHKESQSVLHPWLRRGERHLLYAPPGLGKTWVCFSIAHAAATAGPCLNATATERHSVCYVDAEMGIGRMKERFELIDNAGLESAGSNLRVLIRTKENRKHWDLADEKNHAWFEREIGPVELVVLDNYETCAAIAEGNDAREWAVVSEFIYRLTDAGRAVLLVHHARKSSKPWEPITQKGTNKRQQDMDTIVRLDRSRIVSSPHRTCMEWHFEKGRNLKGPQRDALHIELIDIEQEGRSGIALSWEPLEKALAKELRVRSKRVGSKTVLAKELGLELSEVSRLLEMEF